uniref:Uncharacterized protein n=1 Tax=Arundo donax TaxID=35708 RepID=A0A0A9EHF8_ARUDO
MIWWIVGTAVYHVAPDARMSAQKVDTEKRPAAGSETEAPEARELRRPQRRPCTWKSGRTITVASVSARRYTERMFWTDAARLPCVSGTPLGRLVVPEV